MPTARHDQAILQRQRWDGFTVIRPLKAPGAASNKSADGHSASWKTIDDVAADEGENSACNPRRGGKCHHRPGFSVLNLGTDIQSVATTISKDRRCPLHDDTRFMVYS